MNPRHFLKKMPQKINFGTTKKLSSCFSLVKERSFDHAFHYIDKKSFVNGPRRPFCRHGIRALRRPEAFLSFINVI